MKEPAPKETPVKALSRLRAWLLAHTFYVSSERWLSVNLPPLHCLALLDAVAKPSIKRLEYRNLFTSGRRYFFALREDGGFSMMTTSKVIWHSRRRTRATAIVRGKFIPISPNRTQLQLRGRIKLTYLLDIFLIPTFMTSILIYIPWGPWIIGALIVALYGLSWIGHRYNAALEAHDMMYFIERALEAHLPEADPQLKAKNSDIVYDQQQKFGQAWEKFYEEQVSEDKPAS